MKSTIQWLNLIIYISAPLLAIGLILVGLSFTKIPKNTFRALRGNKKSNEGLTLSGIELTPTGSIFIPRTSQMLAPYKGGVKQIFTKLPDGDYGSPFTHLQKMGKSDLEFELDLIQSGIKGLKQLRTDQHSKAHELHKQYILSKDSSTYMVAHLEAEIIVRRDRRELKKLKTEVLRLLNEKYSNI